MDADVQYLDLVDVKEQLSDQPVDVDADVDLHFLKKELLLEKEMIAGVNPFNADVDFLKKEL